MKFTQASVAAALNQTSNIFVFMLAGMLLHEPINLPRTIGIVLGVSGAYLVTFCG
jgi:drug/metabolite transporter (DMT)-like permease